MTGSSAQGATAQPVYLPTARGRLFAMFHPAARPRAGVAIFPPLLQEHAPSYRLFVILADELAKRDIAVLRPHYYGTGDSDGDEIDFSLDDACTDAGIVMDALRQRIGGVPLIALGVRAGAFVAAAVAARTPLQALWLWQPVTDGAAYLAELIRIDAAERRSRLPNAAREARERSQATLIGFPYGRQLLVQLGRARLDASDIRHDLVLLERAPAATPLPSRQQIELPPTLAAWENQIDMRYIPPAPIREVATRLAMSVGSA